LGPWSRILFADGRDRSGVRTRADARHRSIVGHGDDGGDPITRVVVPRFLGGVIAMPLLAAIFSLIGIYGAQLIGVQIMGVDSGSFWSQMRGGVGLADINEGIVKSVIFGVACSLIAVYEVTMATPTAAGSEPPPRARWSRRRGGPVSRLFADGSISVRGIVMRKSNTLNLGTGAFVVSLSRRCSSSRLRPPPGISLGGPPHYDVTAKFDNIGDLRVGARFDVGGGNWARREDRFRYQGIQGGRADAADRKIQPDSDGQRRGHLYPGLLGGKFIGLTAGALNISEGQGSNRLSPSLHSCSRI